MFIYILMVMGTLEEVDILPRAEDKLETAANIVSIFREAQR